MMTTKREFNDFMDTVVAAIMLTICLMWFMVLGFIDANGWMKSIVPFEVWSVAQIAAVVMFISVRVFIDAVFDVVETFEMENTDH